MATTPSRRSKTTKLKPSIVPAQRPVAVQPHRVEFRLVQTRRTFEEVTAQLRELLFGGSLRPGDRLPPERELSELLGVGRPALREALRTLEVSGLIELRKGKTGGAFVTSGNPRVVSSGMSDLLRMGNVSVEQLFEAREWILSALVRPACRRVTAEELEQMRENISVAERLHAEGRYDERIERNFEFHTLVAMATQNPFAIIAVRGLTDALRSLIDKVGSDLAPTFFSNRRELIKALEARDEEAATKAVARMVKATEMTYKRLAQEKASIAARAAGNAPPLRVGVKVGAKRKDTIRVE